MPRVLHGLSAATSFADSDDESGTGVPVFDEGNLEVPDDAAGRSAKAKELTRDLTQVLRTVQQSGNQMAKAGTELRQKREEMNQITVAVGEASQEVNRFKEAIERAGKLVR